MANFDMGEVKKVVWLQILILFLSSAAVTAQVNKADSVRKIVNKLPVNERLPRLEELSQLSTFEDFHIDYLNLYKDEAFRQHDSAHIATALFLIAKQYYAPNPDSMRYYIDLATPYLIEQGRYEEISRMKAWDIFVMTREGKQEEVLKKVQEYRKLMDDLHYPEGLDMIDQAIGNFYFTNNMPDDAERIYNTVLDRMVKRNAPINRRLNLLALLYNNMPDPQSSLKYLKIAEDYIQKCKDEGVTMLDAETPLYSQEFTIETIYSSNYARDNQMDKAWEHLKKAEAIMAEHQMSNRQIELEQLYMDFHIRQKEYDQAIPYINRVEEFIRENNYQTGLAPLLSTKASVFSEMGHPEEAVEVYKELLVLNDSINQTSFHQTLADMRTQYEIEKLEFEKQQMEEKAQQAQFRITFLIGGCLLMLLIICALGYLIRIIQQNRKDLRQAKEKAEDADRMKSAFLANMNHEIRTPLNAIVGFSQVLVDEEDSENRREFAEIIQNNNELLQRLISDVLDISKIESNSLSLIYAEQDMQSLMREIQNVIQMRMPEGVELIADRAESLLFETDRNRLIQVLTNLLTNAIKHTTEGHIRFGYTFTDDHIQFYIEDTGEGIDPGQLETIFDRFVQLENGTRGVGLGLAISKGLVNKMGGDIWATSIKGNGSTFFVSLPRTRPGN